jgi:hypothetical protein
MHAGRKLVFHSRSFSALVFFCQSLFTGSLNRGPVAISWGLVGRVVAWVLALRVWLLSSGYLSAGVPGDYFFFVSAVSVYILWLLQRLWCVLRMCWQVVLVLSCSCR